MNISARLLRRIAAQVGTVLLLGSPVLAAGLNDYCITPSFLAPDMKSNLLLMIDNSASMYDLNFVDDGKKNADGTFAREPYYCYDQTYKSKFCSNARTTSCSTDSTCGTGGKCIQYSGYFDSDSYYQYDMTNNIFDTVTPFPASCTKYVANTLCVDLDSSTPKKVTKFAAKGSYLNWLTTSKFDVQKQVLTGGKYVGSNLISETRGCVGRGFVKEALAADFVNYNSPESNNPNTGLGITFAIKGPNDTINPTAASPGGQTSIEIYAGDYNQGACQNAIKVATDTTSGQVAIRNAITDCLTSIAGSDLSVETKEKVAFNQTVQECWQYNNMAGTKTVGNDAVSTVKNKCPDIYKDPTINGPDGLTAGHPATICNTTYAGACYSGTAAGGWPKTFGGCNGVKCGDDCIIERHNAYCSSFTALQVTDPTDSPSDTSAYDNLPAILSDIGVQGQLDKPLLTSDGEKTLQVRIAKATAPTGLIQEFANRIRIGAMSFNVLGSASETAALGTPKVCSNALTRTCTVDTDCADPGLCNVTMVSNTSNFDGGKINSYIGIGKCSVTTGTVCATAAHCPADEECISDGVGDHSTGLVNSIDVLRASTWTPLAEAFSSAIGYLAKSTADATGKSSRIGMRVNADDYVANLNPSEYVCQKNNILLITDGMSTADRSAGVTALAAFYNDGDGQTTASTATAATCPKYSGSKNLDDLAWLAKNRNIQTFSTSSTSAAPANLEASEFIKTYAVFTGASNGEAGECDPVTLLDQTAANGGTTAAKKPDNPAQLKQDLKEIFQEISGGTASGTAASILSNSEGSGANILQAVFYPKKNYGATPITWIGELQNLWYFIDPFISNSTVREDTGYSSGTHYLNLKSDYALEFFFDQANPSSTTYNQTMVRRSKDTDGNGTGDQYIDTISPDSVTSLWRAGKKLWATPYDSRTLYTPCLTGGTCLADTTITSDASLGLMSFDTANVTALRPLLQAAASPSTEAADIIKYTQGFDDPALPYRGRTVTIDSTPGVWKLGDIISSTPRLQSSVRANSYDVPGPVGYSDLSYAAFIRQDTYKNRGMVYVGANDGMLHAFKLGKLEVTASGDQKASMTGTGLGEEQWAFIPKNSLPYLRYLTCKAGSGDAFCANQDYNHLYFVDGTTTVADVSTGGCGTSYETCAKDTVNGSNWRTVLLAGMGMGGASSDLGDAADTCVEGVNGSCVKTPIAGVGRSSYFALDITNQYFNSSDQLVGKPKLMWEFAVDGMGFATTGGATVRVGSDKNKNGKWFAVFGSGPTGPIDKDNHQFLGKSTQPLKVFVVDMNATPPFVKNTNYWEISTLADGTSLSNAYVSSVSNSTFDADRWLPSRPGNYQDDALYFGYVQVSSTPIISTTKWRSGGVLRLVTKEDTNPANWKLSKVIDGIGPVTTSIGRLQDRKNHNFWLFFGDGRYTFAGDNMTSNRRLYGLKEPCYTVNDALDPACTTKKTISDLTDQTSMTTASATISNSGWRINLAARDYTNNLGAERVITDPVAMNNGAVFFTTFMPTSDACKFGGNSYLWATRYDTGLKAPEAALHGKALVQVSTGSFEEIDLSTAFTAEGERRSAFALTGKPPSDPPPIVSNSTLKPVKRIIQIQEH